MPFDSFSYPTKNYSYDYNTIPIKVIINQREVSEAIGTLDIYQFYDGFNKLIQTKTEAENNDQIVQDIFYDNNSRISNQSNPYITTFSKEFTTPNVNTNRIIYRYDDLDRITNVTNPDNTIRSTNYDHWITTIYDENNHKKTYYRDAYSNIYSVLEHNGQEIYNTSYTYNAANELIFIKDSLNNTFNFSYDLVGRKIKLIDPDLGTWSYSYDGAGNLIRQVDNKNNIILLSYDQLNRIINKNSTNQNITYTYDREKNSSLSEIKTINLIINISYDDRLRKINEDKSIDSIKFNTIWTYDDLNRITSVKTPEGVTTTYNYNSQGQLNSISSVLNSLHYNEKSQVASRNYSNFLNTSYTYNISNFRLIQINIPNIQFLNYSYDQVGNVKYIGDSINQRTEVMTYDDIDRLISSVRSGNATNQNAFNLVYNYNSIGNILNISSNGQFKIFSYGIIPLHAPISVLDGT